MGFLELAFWQRHQRALGLIAIVIGAGAWGMEFAGTDDNSDETQRALMALPESEFQKSHYFYPSIETPFCQR